MMTVTILGSGTSSGVPTIACSCPTCRSTDPRDRRLRTSVWIESGETSIVIDSSSDFREQCLRAGIEQLDAVVYTHHHFDHIAGFDDLRAFNFKSRRPMPIFLMEETLSNLHRIFDYAFQREEGNQSSAPAVTASVIGERPFTIDGVDILPLPLRHGAMRVNGYRIGNFAYCTDCNEIPSSTFPLLEGLDVLVLDALRISDHPTHFSLTQAIEIAQQIGAAQTYMTHIAHDLKHADVEATLPPRIGLAYDGLKLKLSAPASTKS